MTRRGLVASAAVAATVPGRPRAAGPVRSYKALVRQHERTAVREIVLDPLTPRRVLVRTEAAQCCYSLTGQALGAGAPFATARVIGHGGVGVVEAVGSAVRRVRPGDRVIVPNTPQCGECYNCLNGRPDVCFFKGGTTTFDPIGRLDDGSPVVQHNNTGGIAEYMATYEEFCVPIASAAPAAALSMLTCVAGCGLGVVASLAPVRLGAYVAVFGCGCVGLSAIQGARILGAEKIIAVEPIAARRALALKLGADLVFDPNAEGEGLVGRIKQACRGRTANRFAGDRWTEDWDTSYRDQVGPDLVVEASGGDVFPPKAEAGPDPTGRLALRQAWALCPEGGRLATPAVGQRGDLTLPAAAFANGSRTLYSSSYGGAHPKRDMPRFVGLIERGAFDAQSLVTLTVPLEGSIEAFQAVADRTTVGAVVIFP